LEDWNSEGIYPAKIQDEIERLNRKIHPSNFREAEHRARDSDSEDSEKASRQGGAAHDSLLEFLPVWTFHSSTPPIRLARAEFYHVRHLKVVARQCLGLQRGEASWNSLVHQPLLVLALWKYHDNIALVTSARILSAFMPVLVTGESVQGKMVNFVVSPNFTANYGASS
jgi:hypothetical protein